MKKSLLFSLSFGLAASAIAQSPIVLPEFYSQKISPDGTIIISEGYEDTESYNVVTGERKSLFGYRAGTGNCLSADGTIIVMATEDDSPVIIKNGQELDMSSITSKYNSCMLNGITADGSRIAGLIWNPNLGSGDYVSEDGNTMYVPIVVDLNKDGSLGEVKLLPYPAKDWLGTAPQSVTASYISNDGKTILGQVKDQSGKYIYPIIFKEDKNGNWSYSLPTESLINPNKLPVPEYPGEFQLWPPQYEDYMTEEEMAAYQAALDQWALDGYDYSQYPNIGEYMSPAEILKYNEAAEKYNEAVEEYNGIITEYYGKLDAIVSESVFFLQNGDAMDAEGKVIAAAADKEVIIDPEAEWPEIENQYPTYIIDLESCNIKALKDLGDGRFPIPRQILSDGSVIADTPQPSFWAAVQRPPQGYVLLPGADQYVPVEEKIAKINPSAAEWLKKNYEKSILVGYDPESWDEIYETMMMTGNVVVSDDWSVISGGVMAYLYNEMEELPEGVDEPTTLETYVIRSVITGINEIGANAKIDHIEYFNINGVEVKNPQKGIYVVRTVFSDGSVKTSKAVIK